MSAPEPAEHRLPSPVTLALLVMVALMVAVALVHNLVDADFFWHRATGRLIVERGAIPTTDPFSFTWGGAWTLHEWLGEVLIHLLVSSVGATVTLVVFGALSGVAIWIPAATAVRLGARTLPVVAAAVVATLVLIPFVTVRPQVLSWVLLGMLVALLLSLDAGRPRRVLWLAPLFLVWANLHGLWVVGLVALVVYGAFTLIGRTRMAGAGGWMLAGLVVALVAVMITPAGPGGLLYPLRYIEPGDWGLANIAEWQSPDFHDGAHIGLLLLILGLAGVGVVAAVPGWMAVLALGAVAMSLVSLRNEPIAAVWALPVLALGFDARLPRRDRRRSAATARSRRMLEVGLAVVTIVAIAITLGPRVLSTEAAVAEAGLPVASVDHLTAARPAARVLAEYGWAGYVIDRLADDGARVFVDGRNDMYPDEVLDAYSTLRAATGDWSSILDDHGVDAILLPPGAPLIAAAQDRGNWCPAVAEPGQVLLLRC